MTSVRHGGAERVVLELARRQRAEGDRVDVVCLHALGDLVPAFEAAGVPVRLLAEAQRPGAVRTAWHLGTWLRRTGATVVHTHNAAPQIAAGLGQMLRHWRRPGTVLVHTEHGRVSDLRPAILRLRRWTAGQFDTVIAVSADTRRQLLELGIMSRRGVDVVTNGIDVIRFRPAAHGPRSAHGIVHVGRLDPIKGQDVLVDAMVVIAREVPGAHLEVVGDGPARRALEAQVRTLGLDAQVAFVGAVDDVRPYLDAASVFVLPSRSEGISLALLEAMASGLAVVATDVGGNREVIGHVDCGALVAADDAAALARAVIRLLCRPEMARAMANAAREEIRRRFDVAATMRRYDQYYAGTGIAFERAA
ncbi:MAG: glycosyltransferase [Gemmatimonadales bacterium]